MGLKKSVYVFLIFSAICITILYNQSAPFKHQGYIKKYWFSPDFKMIPKEVKCQKSYQLPHARTENVNNEMEKNFQNNVKNTEALARILNCNCSSNGYHRCKDTESMCGKMKHRYNSLHLSHCSTKQRMWDKLSLIFSDKNSHRSNVTYEFHFTETFRLAYSKVINLYLFVLVFVMIIFGRKANFEDVMVKNSAFDIRYSVLSKSNISFLECCMDYIFSSSVVNKNSYGFSRDLELSKDLKNNTSKNLLNLGWLLKPLNLVRHIPENFVYPVFDLSRLASFQPIALVESHVSFISLAESGFSYTGTGNTIMCEDCKILIDLQEVKTDPASLKYHNRSCKFVRAESSLDTDGIGVPAESLLYNTSSIKNVSSQHNVLSVSGATNFSEENTSAICCFDDELFECECSRDKNCTKTLEHSGFVKFDHLTIEHLPAKIKHQEVLKFFQLCAQLIVKVTNSKLSQLRPPQNRCGIKERLTGNCGTGSLFGTAGKVIKCKDLPRVLQNGKCNLSDESEIGLIYVETNRHIVFNDEEAKNSTVELSLCLPYRNVVELKGGHLDCSGGPIGCKVSLVYSTTNLELVKTLIKLRQELFELAEKLRKDFKEYMSKTVVIISHPHGKEKYLSFGDCVSVKYGIETDASGRSKLFKIDNYKKAPADFSKIKKALHYTAVTCPGSSGAPVICFKPNNCSDMTLDIWMHNGVDRIDDLGVTVLQACTSEDVLRNIPEPTRSGIPQPAQNLPSSATVNLPSHNLNRRALSQPSYPVYISYQKRFESFFAWPAGHIHNPEDLARAGFFYAGYADCVRCYQCGVGLKSWKPGDNIHVEHKRMRPSCPFLQTQLNNGLSSITDSHNLRPQLHSETTSGQNSSSHGRGRDDDNSSSKPQMRVVPTVTENQQPPSQPSTDVKQPNGSQIQAPKGTNVRVNPVSGNGGACFLGETSTEPHGHDNPNETDIQSDDAVPQEHRPEPSKTPQSSSSVDLPPGNRTDSQHGLKLSLLKREKKLLKNQMNCKRCQAAPIKDLFLPCGHLYSCADCSKSLTHCPACNQLILATVTTYFT